MTRSPAVTQVPFGGASGITKEQGFAQEGFAEAGQQHGSLAASSNRSQPCELGLGLPGDPREGALAPGTISRQLGRDPPVPRGDSPAVLDAESHRHEAAGAASTASGCF